MRRPLPFVLSASEPAVGVSAFGMGISAVSSSAQVVQSPVSGSNSEAFPPRIVPKKPLPKDVAVRCVTIINELCLHHPLPPGELGQSGCENSISIRQWSLRPHSSGSLRARTDRRSAKPREAKT